MFALRLWLVATMLAIGQAAAAQPLAVLDAPRARGDTDGDGQREYALVVRSATAAPRPAVFIAVFEARPDGWTMTAAVRLEDGAQVERLRLAPGALTASFRHHYPIDAHCCPSRATVRSYPIVDGTLIGDARAPAWGDTVAGLLDP